MGQLCMGHETGHEAGLGRSSLFSVAREGMVAGARVGE